MNASIPSNVIIKKKVQAYDKNYSHNRKSKSTVVTQRIYLTPALSIFASLVLAEITHADWLMECGSCHCKWNSGKKTADCKNSSLFTIPNYLSPEVQVLDLSHNHITSMEPNIFCNSNLQNLHKLYVRNSSLQKIDRESFADLQILIELDLSNNLLRMLEENQFHHLVKVRAILLNNNLLESLSDGVFQDLGHLHRIELRGNRLSHVATLVFMNLPLLSQIYLDENRLRFLRKESFEKLERLTALSLDHNPWNCSCNLQPFRDFVIQWNLYTPPTSCHYPAHMRSTLWNEYNSETFACKPKVLLVTREASATASSERSTLICRVRASQNTHILWNYNKQSILDSPSYITNRIQIHHQHEELSSKYVGNKILISHITIFPMDESDEGVYTCVAKNAVGMDSAQIDLLIGGSASKDPWLLEENFTAVIGIMALGMLTIGILFAVAACCFNKFSKNYKDCTHHEHLAPRDVKEQRPMVNSETFVRSTSIGGAECKADADVHRHDERQSIEKNGEGKRVKICTNLLVKDGSYLITYISKESSTRGSTYTQEDSNIIVPKQTKVSQIPRWPSKNHHITNRENKDPQKHLSRADHQPDLLSINTKDLNS